MKKICESCGMPMITAEDFGAKNTDNKYCIHCTDELGKLKPFEQKLTDMTHFIMRTSDLNKENAEKMAKETMSKMPAWKAYF
ncbi:MAG: zinc ribbon domain-containing protein [Bacteroidales bacterium]|nr:zinc ribbon domain-containing protein [Bacteroidales bacterium]